MFWLGQGNRPRQLSALRLAVTALIAAGLLSWAPGVRADAYPDAPTEYIAPVCEDDAAPATVTIYGGDVTNTTTLDLSADGGTAIGDASGGDGNIASTGGRAGNGGSITSSAGNGGVSNASADGGAISLGDINSGGNAGNAIGVGDTVAAPGIIPICCEPPYKPVPVYPVPVPIHPDKPRPSPVTPPGKVVVVTRLPDTGAGMATSIAANAAAFMAMASSAASVALRRRMI